MRFLVDECLHESLVELAHAAGFDAIHANHLGLSGKPDWALADRSIRDEFTLVTNNRSDFVRLFGKLELHPGLIVLVPNVTPDLQRALFRGALQYATRRDLVNTVVEVTLEGNTVHCRQYKLPTG